MTGGWGPIPGIESSHQITGLTWAETQARTSQISWSEFQISQPRNTQAPWGHPPAGVKQTQTPAVFRKFYETAAPWNIHSENVSCSAPGRQKQLFRYCKVILIFTAQWTQNISLISHSLSPSGRGWGWGTWPPRMYITSIRLVTDFQRSGSHSF